MTVARPRHAVRTSRLGGLQPTWTLLLPLTMVLVTVGVRLGYLLSDQDRFNGDEAVTGVVVRRILDGHLYIFFPGQSYGGTLEQYLQAFSYLVLRLPEDRLTLRLTQVALAAVTCAMLYACGRRMLPTRAHAVIAALLFSIAPWYNVQNVMSMGFYTISQTISICGFYFAIRLSNESDRTRWAFLFGLACGLGYWNGLITAYTLLPGFFWLLPMLIRRRNAVAALAAGVLIGAAPLVPWILRTHQFVPEPHKAIVTSMAQRLENLAGPIFREFLGVGITGGGVQSGIPLLVVAAVEFILAGGYLALLWRRRRGLVALVSMRVIERSPLDVLLIAAPVTVALYCSSPSAAWTTDPKYLMSAYPLFSLTIAAMLPTRSKPTLALSAVTIVALSGTLCLRYWLHPAWHLAREPLAGQSTLPDSRARDAQLSRAIDYLVNTRQQAVYSNYWTAMPMKYLARDRLTVGTVFPGRERFPEVLPALRTAPSIAYVINTVDADSEVIVNALQAHKVAFQQHRFGPTIEVIDHLGLGARPDELGLM